MGDEMCYESDSGDDCCAEVSPLEHSSDVLNLDITAVFALISALTHGNGANFRFVSSMLNAQAGYERENPVLPGLLKVIEGDFQFCFTLIFLIFCVVKIESYF